LIHIAAVDRSYSTTLDRVYTRLKTPVLLHRLLSIGSHPGESEDEATRRRIFIGAVLVPIALTFPFIFVSLQLGHTREAVANAAFVLARVPVLTVLHLRPRWFRGIVNAVLAMATALQLNTMILFGGLIESGLRSIMGVLVALAALLILGRRSAWLWFGIFAVQVILAQAITGLIEPRYVAPDPGASVVVNVVLMGAVVLIVTQYFVRERERLQKRTDELLHNILPVDVAERLKAGDTPIADQYESASVLFADIVGFTPMSAEMTPQQVIDTLTELFGGLDEIVEKCGLEKIRTVGDEYMVVAGVPNPDDRHAHSIAGLALEFRDFSRSATFDGNSIEFRIGINSGPLVAGVVGIKKFSYDLWGDVVNTASRMESQGEPGEIQISPSTYELIVDDFNCRPRGPTDIKGKGMMETYFLVSRRSQS
jgi:guanylate cyclase